MRSIVRKFHTRKSANKKSWRASVDGLAGANVVGWICDVSSPSHKISVEATLPGGQRASAVANMFRKDLLDAGIGDGFHGFAIDVAGFEGDLRGMVIRRVDTGEVISQQPVTILSTDKERQDVNRRWTGVVDYVDGGVVAGWVIDQEFPNLPVSLVVHTDTGETATGLADIYREDLAAIGKGNGRHGFRIALSNPNYRGTITVRIAASGTSLTEQPIDTDPHEALLAGRVPPPLRRMMQTLAAEIDTRVGHLSGSQAG